MFTGIVEELGEVRKIARQGANTIFEIKAVKVIGDAKAGDSISVNGVCVTVIRIEKDSFSFEAMPQTLKTTGLSGLDIAGKVNLERSLKIGERLSGHFVLGHVDCAGIIRRKKNTAGGLCFEIAVPAEFLGYCLPKGSIAVDGISLTIAAKKRGAFEVYIIPHTLKNTTLNFKGPSDKVNIEFDILVKGNNPA